MESAPERPRRRRKWFVALVIGLVVWVIALIAGAVVVGVTASGGAYFDAYWNEEHVFGAGARIAMIDINGEILPGTGGVRDPYSLGPALAADDYVSMLRQAFEDDGIEGVIVRINSPGGSVAASDQIYQAIDRLSETKPVVALLADEAASGGYYVASAATAIVTDPDTITGDIGVIALFPNVQGTGDKIGARVVVIKSGEFKDIGSPFRAMAPAERKILQTMVTQAYGRFLGAVAHGRGLTEERVRAIADRGQVFSGRDALKLGLADELGGLEEAATKVQELAHVDDDVEVVRYVPDPPGFAGTLAQKLSGMSGDAVVARLSRQFGAEHAGLHYLWLG